MTNGSAGVALSLLDTSDSCTGLDRGVFRFAESTVFDSFNLTCHAHFEQPLLVSSVGSL